MSGTPSGPARPPAPARPGRPAAPGKPTGTDKHGPEPVVASAHRRAPARFSWVGIALLGGAAVIAFTLTLGVFLPAIGALGEAAAQDPGSLPARTRVCERDWAKDTLARTFTRDEIVTRTDAEPIVISTGPAAACPPGVAAPDGDPDGMATTVYVKVGEDAFVAYDLVGGP